MNQGLNGHDLITANKQAITAQETEAKTAAIEIEISNSINSMNTITTSATTATQTTATTATTTAPRMVFQLRKMPSIAPKGLKAGCFTHTEIIKGEKCAVDSMGMLQVSIQLEALDEQGSPFVVKKGYNLDGRGVNALSQDIQKWRGEELTAEELNSFDADTLIIGKPVTVKIGHRGEGKKLEAFIEALEPAPVSEPAN